MTPREYNRQDRYLRQVTFSPLGEIGQRRLASARVLLIGAGGLGSWVSELLARAGVGFIRIVDDDSVDWTNMHRQAMYSEADAEAGKPKAVAAAQRIALINSEITVEANVTRLAAGNIASLAGDVDVILDGMDNFTSRFLVNDYAVSTSLPWIFAGVVGAQGQVMTIIPSVTACLRCMYDAPPPPEKELNAANTGVLGPAVATMASIEALEAVKLLSAPQPPTSPGAILVLDLWNGSARRIESLSPREDCPCCGQRRDGR